MGNKNRDDHLNDCLERLLQGEDVESRLGEYAEEEAEELRLLLKTAGILTRYAQDVKPRPEFVARIEADLEKACAIKYDSHKTGVTRMLKPVGLWALPGAIAAVMALFTFTGGFALADAATRNTVSGETLYPVKVAAGKVRAILSLPGAKESGFIIQAVETKPDEIVNAADEIDIAGVEAVPNGPESHPGNAESAPGHQSPVSGDNETGAKSNDGKSESAPGHQSPASGDSGTDEKTNPGKSDLAPGHQSPASGDSGTDEKTNSGKSGLAPGHKTTASGDNETGKKYKSGK